MSIYDVLHSQSHNVVDLRLPENHRPLATRINAPLPWHLFDLGDLVAVLDANDHILFSCRPNVAEQIIEAVNRD